MKSFRQWAENLDLEVPLVEKQLRAGIASWAYPDAYARQQYPAGYFTPIAADALQKMGAKADDSKVDRGGKGPDTAIN
jgi:hypothetical protein